MKLTNVQRRVLRYHGQPADRVSVLERLTVHEVLEARQQLASMGAVGVTPYAEPTPAGRALEDQLSFDQMMRANRAPRPVDVELEHTTSTDPDGW